MNEKGFLVPFLLELSVELILWGKPKKTISATVNSVSQTLLTNHSLNIDSQFISIIIA